MDAKDSVPLPMGNFTLFIKHSKQQTNHSILSIMNTDNEELVFDENEAIDFIWNYIPEEDKQSLTKDDIQYILDVVYDYYESEGLIEDDTAEDASIDEEKMYNYIKTAVSKDNMQITDELIQLILDGEFEYGVSIGIYEEED